MEIYRHRPLSLLRQAEKNGGTTTRTKLLQAHFKENRIIFFGSFALVALTRFLVEMPVSELFALVTTVFGLNLLVCFINYKRDPSQSEFENFKKESQDFMRQVREHQAIVDSISAERHIVEKKLAEIEGAIRAQKNR